MVQVKVSEPGFKYLIPSEYDILINFAPVSYNAGKDDGQKRGSIKIQTKIISDPSEYDGAEGMQII